MAIFRRKIPKHFIPVHPHNIAGKDWVILLEAGTIIGPSPEKLRVARCTQEKKIVMRRRLLLGAAEHFLVLDDYDPRIHAVYFCPQLYKHDADKKLVPLQGEEIGRPIARAVEAGVVERRPWYQPASEPPQEPVITSQDLEYDTVVIDMPGAKTAAGS